MKTERGRRTAFAMLLAAAVLGAVAFMAGVVLENMLWRLVVQVGGLGVCLLSSGVLVVLIRRWTGSDDDFWWPDPGG